MALRKLEFYELVWLKVSSDSVAFRSIRKTTASCAILSIHTQQLGSQWTEFCEIILRIATNIYRPNCTENN